MLRTIRQFFFGDDHEGFTQSRTDHARFVLWFREMKVGDLALDDGEWTFEYSEAFRAQANHRNGVRPLADFPDVHKRYQSPALWPFFLARIPSTAQPEVQERIAQRGIDAHNAAQLLREFGERSIANAFLVRPAA